MRLKTECLFPTIPDLNSDWVGYVEDEYDAAENPHPIVERGQTAAANADFTDQWLERQGKRATCPSVP